MDVFSKGGDDFWAYHDISIRSMYAEFCAKLTKKTERITKRALVTISLDLVLTVPL